MPRIDVVCGAGHKAEVFRAISDWPNTPPCPECQEPTVQYHPSDEDLAVERWKARSVDPVVVYQAPDGSIRVPPDIDSASTAMYDGKGYQRIELRGWADVRRFERHMDKHERSQINRRIERQQAQFEASEKERRSEIRRQMEQGFVMPVTDREGRIIGTEVVRLSDRSKAIMRAAMDMNDRKGGPKAYDAGCHFEAYSMDRSNRAMDPRRRGQ